MSENYSTVELIETAVNDFMTQYKKEVSNGFVPSVNPAVDDICEDETIQKLIWDVTDNLLMDDKNAWNLAMSYFSKPGEIDSDGWGECILWYQDEVAAEVASELEKLAESER